MSSQPTLDFGVLLAPRILLAGDAESPLARVHSPDEAIPGEGRYVVTCKRCERTRRRKRPSKFCCDLCRTKWRHEEQGRIEAGKKERAMRGSAALHATWLRIARTEARLILKQDGTADADRVRLSLESKGTEFAYWSGWSGSIFPADPAYQWTAIDWVKAKHKASKNRPVRVWK